MQRHLFPPYLNEGSYGEAVLVMQILLNMLDPLFQLELTGVHTGRSVDAVRRLQHVLGFTGENVDGNFGPGTRRAMRLRLSIDVDAVPWPVPTTEPYTMWIGPDHEGIRRWPEETS
jgi:hypothetical protein